MTGIARVIYIGNNKLRSMEKINELANNYKNFNFFLCFIGISIYFLIIYCYYNLISLIKKVKQLISIIIPTYNSEKLSIEQSSL